MKLLHNYILSYILCSILFVIGACSSDDGNYDYVDPVTVDFNDMPTALSTIVGDRLFIEGVFATEANESDLEYLWYKEITTGFNDPIIIDTISTEKNLDIINSLPEGNVELYYNVYNRARQVNYRHTIEMVVGSKFSLGWGVLKDMGDGTADYDFVSDINSVHLENNLLNVTGERLQGTPVFLNYCGLFSGLNYSVWLSVFTDSDARVYANSNLETRAAGLGEYFAGVDNLNQPITGGIPARENSDFQAGYIHIGGQLFGTGYNSGVPDFPEWSNIPLSIDGDYQVSFSGVFIGSDEYLVYDDLNKRYLSLDARGGRFRNMSTYTTSDTSPFDANDLNDKSSSWLGALGFDGVVSLVSDEAGSYHFQRFSIGRGQILNPGYEVAIPDGLVNASSILCSSQDLGNVYYSNGGNIGRFVDGDNPSESSFQSEYITAYSGETVTALYSPYVELSSKYTEVLAIGLEGPSGSSLVLYDIVNDQEISRYEVEGKIVDIKYANGFPLGLPDGL